MFRKNIKKNAWFKGFTFYHKPHWMLTYFHHIRESALQMQVETPGYQPCSIGEYHCKRLKHSLPESSRARKWQLVRCPLCFLMPFYLRESKTIWPIWLKVRNLSQGIDGYSFKYAQYEMTIQEKDMCVEVLSFNFFILCDMGYCIVCVKKREYCCV